MKPPEIKECQRSSELRQQLREEGYRELWDVRENMTRCTYWNNSSGKSIVVIEHAVRDYEDRNGKNSGYVWAGWDIFTQLCRDNHIAKTYEALHNWTAEVGA